MAISVAALLVAIFWSKEYRMDAVMWAMAVLSLLVLLLIGWNIYTLFDLKNIDKKIRRESEARGESIGVMLNSVYTTNASMFSAMAFQYDKFSKGKSNDMVYVFAIANIIHFQCLLGDLDDAERSADLVCKKIPHYEEIATEDKALILNLLVPIKKEYKLAKVNELVTLVLRWKTYDS